MILSSLTEQQTWQDVFSKLDEVLPWCEKENEAPNQVTAERKGVREKQNKTGMKSAEGLGMGGVSLTSVNQEHLHLYLGSLGGLSGCVSIWEAWYSHRGKG